MNEKWEVRWERLRMCECSLGAREPGGAGARPLLGWGHKVVNFHHCPEKSPHSYRAKGLRGPHKTPTSTCCWKPCSNQPVSHSLLSSAPRLMPGCDPYRVRPGKG